MRRKGEELIGGGMSIESKVITGYIEMNDDLWV